MTSDSKNNLILIGLMGLRGSGKSTVTKLLSKEYHFIDEAMANPLKETVKAMFGFTDKQVYGELKDKETIDSRWGISPRDALQYIGTDVIRNKLHELIKDIGDNFWVRHFEIRHQKYIEDSLYKQRTGIAISDTRFQNEVDYVHKHKGFVIKIVRPKEKETKEDINSLHASEKAMEEIKDFDYLVINDGSIEELYTKIRKIMEKMMLGT